MYTEVSEFKDSSLGPGIVKQTRQQIIQKYSELSTMFPDVKDEIIQTYPSGDQHIIVEFVSTGTAPDNTKFQLPICTVFTIENGLISKDFTYYDNFETKTTNCFFRLLVLIRHTTQLYASRITHADETFVYGFTFEVVTLCNT